MKRILGALRRGKVMLLALMVALTLGAASTAIGHTGFAGLFHKNHSNTVNAISTFVGSVAGPILRLDNNNAGGTALDLQVEPNRPPLTVNSAAGTATNLSADTLDGKDSGAFLPNATYTKQDTGLGFDIGGGARLLETFCDSGDVIVSGGHFELDQGTTLRASGPDDFHEGWQVQWINDATADTITVVAYCADFGTPH
jgi:hypothetical protein